MTDKNLRGKNLIQFLKAVDLVSSPQGITIDEFSEKLGFNRRTAYRQIQVLEELGFPVFSETDSFDRKKRWKMQPEYIKKLPNLKLPNVSFTLSEVISLYLLKGEARIYKGTDIEKKINSGFAKLNMFVPDGFADKLEKIKTLFIPASKFSKDYSGKEKIIEELTDAVFQRRTCLMKYHSFGNDTIKEYKVDPLYFFENKGGLYMFARVKKYDAIRIFAIERIQKIEHTYDTFEYPEDFDPREACETAFDIVFDDPVEVRIWFSADQAKYIKERVWAKGQKITTRKDGSIVLEMKTSGSYDVKRWVLSFGDQAEVLKPEALRKEIARELGSARELYLK